MNGCVKYFDNDNKYIIILVHDKELLKKYNEIWDTIKNLFNLFKKEFNIEPVYNYKFIKTKIKICNNKINASFCDNKISEDNAYCVCLYVILLDSIFVDANKEC